MTSLFRLKDGQPFAKGRSLECSIRDVHSRYNDEMNSPDARRMRRFDAADAFYTAGAKTLNPAGVSTKCAVFNAEE